MVRVRLLGGPAEEIPCIWIEAEPRHRYAYASTLRPWNLASLPRRIREAAIVEGPSSLQPHPRYPFGVVEFRRRIPAAVCDQLSIEEVP